MKIGEQTFAVQPRPATLDAQLVELTGCDAAEVAGMLAANPIAGLVAVALLPFLEDGPSAPELANLIAEAGVLEVAAEVAALYAVGGEPPADAPAGDA